MTKGDRALRPWEDVMKSGLKLLCGALLTGAAAMPASAETDFSGETIEWVIPFSESGGSAAWAGLYGPMMSEALPGKPTVIAKFMPGAGSTKGANWFERNEVDDGTVIFSTSASTILPYLLGDPRVQYDPKNWTPILASGTGGVAYLPPDLAKKFDGTGESLADINFIYGSMGATRLDLVPLLAWEMLGMKVEPVFGVKGRSDGRLMFERGEANIDYQTSGAYISNVMPLVDGGTAVPMMTWGAMDEEGNIVRDPTFPDLPTFKEVCEATAACETSGDAWDAWKAFFVAGFPVQKILYLPGSTDQEIVDTYVNALKSVIAQPDFHEKAEAELGDYPQLTGKAAVKALDAVLNVPESAQAFVIKWLDERYGVKLE